MECGLGDATVKGKTADSASIRKGDVSDPVLQLLGKMLELAARSLLSLNAQRLVCHDFCFVSFPDVSDCPVAFVAELNFNLSNQLVTEPSCLATAFG